ncbi:MAG: 2-succinyl-5-enolpyruvyl-6-hydroxy-3-cyclohexene-carboxylate synthase [Ilumatobacteraceae bacterium]|nr:2-succinyl-5-enolpyruvyl-6-hydroxy-3-cyclohexene-carboxylate synthase [Ilumatobacteraceae bacterium]
MSAPHTPSAAQDVTATFCATLIDEWIHNGVRHAVVAPGSRSTPIALALAARDDIEVHVFHDERSASFAALGIGLATELPAVLVCTSGTAAAHFHAAVVEAHQSAVPLIVCTADRPPELRDVGAPQTIDQTQLYGAAVRWFHDPGVPSADAARTWRSTAAHAFATSVGLWPGPVHLNLPFREPLVGIAAELPPRRLPGRASASNAVTPALADLADLSALAAGGRGVIVAGRGCGDPFVVADLAASLGWPVLADVRCGLRSGLASHERVAVAAFDDILRSPTFTGAHVPEIVLRLGESPASKVLGQWLAALDVPQVHVSALPTWSDPDGVVDCHVTADVAAVCTALAEKAEPADPSWLADWRQAEDAAQAAISRVTDGTAELSEPAVARVLGRNLPSGANLMVSSSMPIRDVEWYADRLGETRVFANRGANGIDGVIATATGIALATSAPTFVLIGDVAFLHDSSSLTALASRGADVRIVLVDNDGGGIFSFLPQASALAADRFELLFGTPHGTDLAALAAAHGLRVDSVDAAAGLVGALAARGPRVVHVRSDRVHNVRVHDEIHRAVAAALDADALDGPVQP